MAFAEEIGNWRLAPAFVADFCLNCPLNMEWMLSSEQ